MRGWPVSRILSSPFREGMTIPLGPPSPTRSSCQPGPLGLKRPCRDIPAGISRREAPIRHCSRWGLPCRSGCPSRGGLLPHRFTLTRANRTGGLFSVALSLGLPRPGVTRHRRFMESGLSSGPKHPRSSSHPREAHLRGRDPRGQRASRARPAAITGPASSSGPVAQGRNRRRNGREAAGRPRPPDSRRPARPPRSRPGAAASGQTDSPARASRRQSKRGPGSAFRSGAMSECAITPSGAMPHRSMTPRRSGSSAAICRSGKGERPSFCNSMPMEREFTSPAPPHVPPRVPRPHLLGDERVDAPVLSDQPVARHLGAPDRRAAPAPPPPSPSRCNGARSASGRAPPRRSPQLGEGRWTISTRLSRRAPRGTGSGPSRRRSRPRPGRRPAGRPPARRVRGTRAAPRRPKRSVRRREANRASARKPDRR